MTRMQSKLLDADQVLFDDIDARLPIKENRGFDEWPGRFWLPDGDRVDPTREHCSIRGDRYAGEMIMEQFTASDSTEDIVISESQSRLA